MFLRISISILVAAGDNGRLWRTINLSLAAAHGAIFRFAAPAHPAATS
jgi:hypothetical protein